MLIGCDIITSTHILLCNSFFSLQRTSYTLITKLIKSTSEKANLRKTSITQTHSRHNHQSEQRDSHGCSIKGRNCSEEFECLGKSIGYICTIAIGFVESQKRYCTRKYKAHTRNKKIARNYFGPGGSALNDELRPTEGSGSHTNPVSRVSHVPLCVYTCMRVRFVCQCTS